MAPQVRLSWVRLSRSRLGGKGVPREVISQGMALRRNHLGDKGSRTGKEKRLSKSELSG